MLDKKHRINREKDYNYIYKMGKRISGKYIIVFIRENQWDYNRFGFVTSKKVGNAVIRNRAKRQMRAITRKHFEIISPGHDFIIVVKSSIKEASFNQIENDLLNAMRKARLI